MDINGQAYHKNLIIMVENVPLYHGHTCIFSFIVANENEKQTQDVDNIEDFYTLYNEYLQDNPTEREARDDDPEDDQNQDYTLHDDDKLNNIDDPKEETNTQSSNRANSNKVLEHDQSGQIKGGHTNNISNILNHPGKMFTESNKNTALHKQHTEPASPPKQQSHGRKEHLDLKSLKTLLNKMIKKKLTSDPPRMQTDKSISLKDQLNNRTDKPSLKVYGHDMKQFIKEKAPDNKIMAATPQPYNEKQSTKEVLKSNGFQKFYKGKSYVALSIYN